MWPHADLYAAWRYMNVHMHMCGVYDVYDGESLMVIRQITSHSGGETMVIPNGREAVYFNALTGLSAQIFDLSRTLYLIFVCRITAGIRLSVFLFSFFFFC